MINDEIINVDACETNQKIYPYFKTADELYYMKEIRGMNCLLMYNIEGYLTKNDLGFKNEVKNFCYSKNGTLCIFCFDHRCEIYIDTVYNHYVYLKTKVKMDNSV